MQYKIVSNTVVVSLCGDIDEFCVRQLKVDIDTLIDNIPNMRAMVFDMGKVTFIDSTGLGFVLGRYKKLREKHAELLLCDIPKQVDKVFRTSGIYSFAPIVEKGEIYE